MKLSHLLLPIILVLGLTSCNTVDKTESIVYKDAEDLPVKVAQSAIESSEITEAVNLNQLCNPEFYVYHPVIPVPPITGTERAEPIVLMTRQEFNERIQLSPLWASLYDKKLRNSNYGLNYSLLTLGKLIGASSYINVESRLDGHYWKEGQRITNITYSNYGIEQRSRYQHQLLKQERIEMIETLKLVIDDLDDKTAASIIDKLYQQYLQKVENREYLSDGQTIHTYLKYDGKFIALWGSERLDHEIEQCNYRVLSALTIS